VISGTLPTNQAGLAFDTLAEDYDAHFTQSRIGRAQRDVVWRETGAAFQGRHSILELNCGTGEDALFLSARGHRVTALDASRAMIDRASMRKVHEAPEATVEFRLLPTEYLGALPQAYFDAIFSNFSGLNCVGNLSEVAEQLAQRTLPDAPALLCISTRVCLWEAAWFLMRGQPRKAVRRWSGHSTAILNGVSVTVHYPTVREFSDAFAPQFALRRLTGIGIFVPPSYLEPWMQHLPWMLALMRRVDRVVCHLPLLRTFGDHVLLHFVRTAEEGR
jgi:SAM-dependent methyltransferase